MSVMGKKLTYTVDTVERALDIHKASGLIKEWGYKGGDRWFVVNSTGEPFELRSLREAYVLVNGLGSAANARVRAEV